MELFSAWEIGDSFNTSGLGVWGGKEVPVVLIHNHFGRAPPATAEPSLLMFVGSGRMDDIELIWEEREGHLNSRGDEKRRRRPTLVLVLKAAVSFR